MLRLVFYGRWRSDGEIDETVILTIAEMGFVINEKNLKIRLEFPFLTIEFELAKGKEKFLSPLNKLGLVLHFLFTLHINTLLLSFVH